MIGMFKIQINNYILIRFAVISFFQFFFLLFRSQTTNSSFSFFNSIDNFSVCHPSIQPFLEPLHIKFNIDSTLKKSIFSKKLWEESLLDVVQDDVYIIADPLFNFSIGKNVTKSNFFFSNVRGFRIAGSITSKVSFETRFYENQFIYPDYLSDKAKFRASHEPSIDAIAFGIGRAKIFKENGLDASLSNGYLSFSPFENINFQLGHGRHFFGNGYRSLVLSDYAPDYPYFSAQYYLFNKKILYKHVTAWMTNLNRIPSSSTSEALFVPKSSNFNQFSFQESDKFSISIFEGSIYNNYNSLGRVSPLASFYVPILGASLIDRNSTNSTNLIYGLNWNLQFFENWTVFNQYSMNSDKKIGVQIGLKHINLFGFKQSFLNIEFNTLPTGFYSTDSSSLFQKYSHLGHELAHPLGSGFKEFLFKGQFSCKNLFIRMNYNYVTFKVFNQNDVLLNQVFTSKEELVSQTSYNKVLLFINTSIGLYFNPKTNMEISLGHIIRKFNNQMDNFLTLSWRTYLKNDYFDQ